MVRGGFADLLLDDPTAPIVQLPRTWEVARTGLDFVIPLVVLLWCLTVEQLSPGLSAFWGTIAVIGIVATRKPLLALFRRQDVRAAALAAYGDLVDGLALGARNMIGIAIATATAGIVVGTVTLTGLGLMMTEFVEFISGGNVIAMLVLIALISLILGMGIPTTANYILVATLMAPVVVELGAQAGLAIPLIAVHLFVFYFGIMADITPPVGLAAFAAAAISKEDPIATGFQGSVYSLRTAILPFVFVFNPELLLIDIGGWAHLVWVIFVSSAAILVFAAATMNWFVTKKRLWESAVLLPCCFTLLRPGWFLDRVYPAYVALPARELLTQGRADARRPATSDDGRGGEPRGRGRCARRSASGSATCRSRGRGCARSGLAIASDGEKVPVAAVAFASYAKRVGLEPGYQVLAVLQPAERPSRTIPAGLALLIVVGVAGLQYARMRKHKRFPEALT